MTRKFQSALDPRTNPEFYPMRVNVPFFQRCRRTSTSSFLHKLLKQLTISVAIGRTATRSGRRCGRFKSCDRRHMFRDLQQCELRAFQLGRVVTRLRRVKAYDSPRCARSRRLGAALCLCSGIRRRANGRSAPVHIAARGSIATHASALLRRAGHEQLTGFVLCP